MEGIIKEIDLKKGMVTVSTENGYSIFEIISDDNFNIGDEVNWKEENPFGDCRIYNASENEYCEVYFQNH